MRRSLPERATHGALALGLAAATALGGCAFEPGLPWGILELDLNARFDPPPDRLTEEGWLMTSLSYGVAIDSLQVGVEWAAVRVATGGGGTATFDPADPPEGFTNCHGGHCHAADGSLPTYEQVEAIVLGSAGVPLAGHQLTGPDEPVALDAEPVELALGPCPEDCQLPRGELVRVEVQVGELELSGHVLDLSGGGRLPEEGLPLDVLWHLDTTLSEGLDGRLSEAEPPGVRVDVLLDLPAALFDAIDWAEVTDPAALEATLVENVASHHPLTHDLKRFDP